MLAQRYARPASRAIASGLFATTLITGCGGGGGSDPGPQPPPPTVAVTGVAVDGYIAGATIRCLSDNGTLIASTTSGAKGEWSFSLPQGVRCDTIESVGGTDVGLGDGSTAPVALSMSTVYRARVDHIDPAQLSGATLAVSPVTSLIAALQTQGTTLDEARSRVRTAFGIAGTVDPLKTDPIASNDLALFKAGNVTAAAIREISNGIADALRANGAAQEVYVGSLALSKNLAMDEIANALGQSNALLDTNTLPQAVQTATAATLNALKSTAGASAELKKLATALPPLATSLSVSAFAIDAAESLLNSNSIKAIAAAAVSLAQTDPKKIELIGALLAKSADIDAIPAASQGKLIDNLRQALANSNGGNVNLSIPCEGVEGCEEIAIPILLKSYLEIVDSEITLLTTGNDFPVRIDEFSSQGVTFPVQSGAGLSGVAVRIAQANDRPQLDASPRLVDLGFTLVKIGDQPLYLSALVKGLGLSWLNDQIAVSTAGATLIAAVRFGEATWSVLTLPTDSAASLVSAKNGELRIDLERLSDVTLVIGTFLGTGTFDLSAVIQDRESDLIFATRADSSETPSAVIPTSLTVQDKQDGSAAPVQLVGPGFTGRVTLQ
jgi:hypothetical protein